MSELIRKILLVLGAIVAICALISAHLVYILSIPDAPEVKHTPITIAAAGDSITDGSGDISDTLRQDSYPAHLQELLGDEYLVLNHGLSGATLLSSGDVPYRDSEAYRSSLETDADIVLIMLGTNDSKPRNWNAGYYEKQLEELINTYEKLPKHPAVYAMTPPAAYENTIEVDGSVIEKEIVPMIYRASERTNIPVIDIFTITKDHPEYFFDGVHPTYDGNKLIADTVYDALL